MDGHVISPFEDKDSFFAILVTYGIIAFQIAAGEGPECQHHLAILQITVVFCIRHPFKTSTVGQAPSDQTSIEMFGTVHWILVIPVVVMLVTKTNICRLLLRRQILQW